MKQWLCLFLTLSTLHTWALQIGDTRDQVVTELGQPLGEMTQRGVQILTYQGGVVELEKGRVSYIQPGFEKRVQERRAEAAFEAEQTAKGLVNYHGEWIETAEAERRQKKEEEKKNAVQEIRQNGAAIDLKKVIVPGKITIVDFFADWCGPCKRMGPLLEELAHNNSDVCLRKIDIVNWQSAVVKQHNINSVPNVWVFDRQGKLVGPPSANIQNVKDFVKMAK